MSENELELRLLAENKAKAFEETKNAVTEYLLQNGVKCEIYCSDKQPEANADSGKFKHIVAMKPKPITSQAAAGTVEGSVPIEAD